MIPASETTFIDSLAEEYVCALLVREPDCRDQIADELRPEMFAEEVCRKVFEAACSLLAEQMNIDDLTLSERLGCRLEQPQISIGLLKKLPVSTENLSHYIKRIQESFSKRQLADVISDALNQLNSGQVVDFGKFRAEFEDRLLRDLGNQRRKVMNFAESVDLIQKAKESGGMGYSWGIKKLDHATGGIIPGRYYAIGGLKKSGKSLFAVSTVLNLTLCQPRERRVPCLVVSLEMSDHQFNCAMLSNAATVNSRKFGTPYIDSDELSRCSIQAEKLDTCPIYLINQPGMTVDQILATIRRHVRKGVKVVLIDYLQRIDIPSKTDNRATAIQKAVNRLADGARKYDVALLLISQLANRAEFEADPSIGDFKESGGIAEACDCALILKNHDRNRKSPLNRDREDQGSGTALHRQEQHRMDILIPVQRVGISNTRIPVRHDLRFARFFDTQEIATSPISTCPHCQQDIWSDTVDDREGEISA